MLSDTTLPDSRICRFGADLEDPYQAAIAAGHGFDGTWRLFDALSRPGSVFLDVGANIGLYSLPAAIKGVHVHSFELLADNANRLAAGAVANSVRIAVINAAVADGGGMVAVAGHSAYGRVVSGPGSMRKISLDAYARQHNIESIDVVKIEVEGSELSVLRGMIGILRRCAPDVIIESNVWWCGASGYSYRDLLRFLAKLGYLIYRIEGGWLRPWKLRWAQEVACADYLATMKTLLPWRIRRSSSFHGGRDGEHRSRDRHGLCEPSGFRSY